MEKAKQNHSKHHLVRISEEVLYITKMVEKVGLATFSRPDVLKMLARPHISGLENDAGPTFSTIS